MVVTVSPFTMGVVLAAALVGPGLVLVGALLVGRLLWRRWA